MDSKTIIRALEKDGWSKVSQSGSHIKFRHPVKPGNTVVARQKKDIPLKTVRSIDRQSGLKFR
jgi:predicted RNA binding protein YcfA (HicA-like mRNA interferase family)